MNETFFFSEALKGIIDEDSLTGSQSLTTGDTPQVTASFRSLSLKDDTMTLKVSMPTAKSLLDNPQKNVTYVFMDELWFLSPQCMELVQEKNGEIHVTLQIIDRQKGEYL